MAEKKRNAYSDLFESLFRAEQIAQGVEDPAPYLRQAYDYVQLFNLFDKGEKAHWPITLERWTRATENYFQSSVGHRTMADLCVRFSTFYKGPLNEYGKPVNGTPRKETASERNVRNIREGLERFGITPSVVSGDRVESETRLLAPGSKS